MNVEQVSEWVATGESETLEFKETTGQRRDAAKSLCAMLNQKGGRVLFGVTPNREARGQVIGEDTLNDIAQEMRQIDPPVFPTIVRVPVDTGREVLVVTVPVGRTPPYKYREKAYRRVGSTNQVMSNDEYNRVLLERLHAETRWENQPAENWTADDLDHE